jgi:hypothetical protein
LEFLEINPTKERQSTVNVNLPEKELESAIPAAQQTHIREFPLPKLTKI